jgi:Ca-activated chloride channel family protein
MVTFQASWALLLLPVLAAWGVWRVVKLRHQWETAFRFSRLATLEFLDKRPNRIKRLTPWVCKAMAALFLVLAMARPVSVMKVPVKSVDMMLVMDISLSMMAEDLPPNRLTSAKQAAITFVGSLPPEIRVGLTLFAGNAYVLTPPTSDHNSVVQYLKALKTEDLQPRTEIGTALINTLRVINPTSNQKGESVIVLFSDGDSQEGYPWADAARKAQQERTRVYTVGVGALEHTAIFYKDQWLPVAFSEKTMRAIAEITQAEYFRVFRAEDFQQVYSQIEEKALHLETRREELSWVFAALALLALMTQSVLTVYWLRPMPPE